MDEQALFLSCGLISLGFILAIVGALGARQASSRQRWPIHPGEIISAQAASGEGGSFVQVRYSYRVAEKTYTGSRIFYHGASTWLGPRSEPLEAIVRRYPVGKAVIVHAHPVLPERSAFEPGAGLAAVLPLAAGGLFFVLGLLVGAAALF